jgi:hypothetical protein
LRPAPSRGHLYVTRYTEGFSHFVTSMTAPVASGWSVCRVGLAPTGKRRLLTAHANSGHCPRARRMCQVASLLPCPTGSAGRKARESGLQPNAQVGPSAGIPEAAMCARHFQVRSRCGGPTKGARRLVAPFLGEANTGCDFTTGGPLLARASRSRRLHVQFNVEKHGVLERALVAPVALECTHPGRALISACSGNDLEFADNMAACLGCRIRE